MTTGPPTTQAPGLAWLEGEDQGQRQEEHLALVIAWSAQEPGRAGEVALLEEGQELVLGRGEGRLPFLRQRPAAAIPTPPLEGAAISRRQLKIRGLAGGAEVERLGRCPMLVNGVETDRATLGPGDRLTLKHQLVLYGTLRPRSMAPLHSLRLKRAHPFGQADPHGLVGESPAAWELRDQVAFCAATERHLLILGESGSGKELVAHAVHLNSRRHRRPMVSRNAATFPAGLIDAELFGNIKDYPNPGMAPRPGVIGEADGSTLFLDELGELPQELQGHLLRVLDRGGEYQRLGDASARRADLRLLAATNRDPKELKHDLLARLTLRLTLPSLDDRRDDIPLLLRHLLKIAAGQTPALVERFFDDDGEARVHPDLIEALLTHHYSHNVRELDALLWQAISGSRGRFLDLTQEVHDALHPEPDPTSSPQRPDPTAEEIRACLAEHGGNVSRAWPALGLKSRYALYRLMKKLGIPSAKDSRPKSSNK